MATSHVSPGVPVFRILLFLATVLLGAYLEISAVEWAMILISTGLVVGAEGFYFSLTGELDPKSYHPFAHNSKDIAAGAAVISLIASIVVWLCVFAPHLG